MARKVRQCHGCHGFNDEDHEGIPLGVGKCPLDHDDRCNGGIVGGKDSKGSEWSPCPVGYLCPADRADHDDTTDSEDNSDEYQDSGDLEPNSDLQNLNVMDRQLPPQLVQTTPTSSSTTTPAVGSPPTTTGAGSLSSLTTSQVLGGTTVVTSAQQAPVLSTKSSLQSTLDNDMASLQKLRQERENLEQQARLVEQQQQLLEQQQLSAKQVEIKRQVRAEKERIKMLKKGNKKPETNFIEDLRQQSQAHTLNPDFQSYYGGPNIKEIRKTRGLRGNVEDVVDTIRLDNPSLGRRPTAGKQASTIQNSKHLGARKKDTYKEPIDPVMQEFQMFKAWRESQSLQAADSESDDDASPPRAPPPKRTRKPVKKVDNPITDSSSSEDDTSEPMVLVYRRDEHGVKYRSYEPAQVLDGGVHGNQGRAGHVRAPKYTWVKDPHTGREYKRAMPTNQSSSNRLRVQAASISPQHGLRYADHRAASGTPETGYRSGRRSPTDGRTGHHERIPGIVPLEQKEGKIDDRRAPTIIDWAKNCPVTYAEKIKYDEMNLPVWVWAYVSEILSSRTGLSPDMPKGELEARLQHLLCVLQVALIHSEKSDFNTKGWTIASIYAKRIQQKLDRKLDTWESFSRFGHDPHPSEMFAAKTEADSKAPKKKDDGKFERGKKMCSTWNNCEVEKKCQYLVKNPTARCFNRHECSYCIEKNHGIFSHQRRFCAKRRAAGDD